MTRRRHGGATVRFGKPREKAAITGDCGQPGAHFNTPYIATLQRTSFTVAVWVNLSARAPNFILADWNKPDYSYMFGIDQPRNQQRQLPTVELRSSKIPQAEIDNKQNRRLTAVVRAQPNKDIPLNEWHHLAWVWTRTDISHGTMKIYLDGVQIGSQDQQFAPVDVQANIRPVRIGSRQEGNTTFHGSLDELWLFNEALSEALTASDSLSSELVQGAPQPPASGWIKQSPQTGQWSGIGASGPGWTIARAADGTWRGTGSASGTWARRDPDKGDWE